LPEGIRSKMIDSVRTRLTIWYVGILALVIVVFGAGIYALLSLALNTRLDSGLRASVDATLVSLARGGAEGEPSLVAAVKALSESSFREQAVAIFDSGGRLIAEKTGPDGNHARLPFPLAIPRDTIDFSVVAREPAGSSEDFRVAARRVAVTWDREPYLIVVAQSMKSVSEGLAPVREALFIGIPIAMALAGIVGWFLAGKSLSPVRTMAETARRITAENLEQRLPVANPKDELGSLATTFNELLSRLDGSFDQQRRFMADASHELRTPLHVMRTAAEVTLDQEHRSEHEYRDALHTVAVQAQRLTRIVDDMFTLARADAGDRSLSISDFYLDELIEEVVRASRILGSRKNVTVTSNTPAEAPVRGDEDLLRRMILNLADNAVKHTPPGGSVALTLDHEGGAYRIRVSDSGPGIPADAQARIFERFYRAQESRERSEGGHGAGAGLGLSIALWIAEAHGGRLALERSDESGSVFRVTLPAAPEQNPPQDRA